LNIVFVHSNCILDQYQVHWRCANIASAIDRTGLNHTVLIDIPSFITNDDTCQRICSEADLIVIHRYNIGPVLQAALYWKAQNKKIVLDIDEALTLISEDMEQYRFWTRGEMLPHLFPDDYPVTRIVPPPVQQITWAMMHIDAITVSSERLAGDYEEFGRVWVIPDYVDFNQYLVKREDHKNEIWIGFGGGSIPFSTFEKSGMIYALEEVCHSRQDVRLFLGNMPTEVTQRIDIPNHQKVICSWFPLEDWALYLANIDIGLAPVVSEYDLRTSRNRVLEYLALKIPWIASDHLPYRNLNKYGLLVENTREDWIQNLMITIDSLNYYKKRAEKEPYLYAISQDINENIGKILKVYESILKG